MKSTELLLISEIIKDVGLMCSTSVIKDLTYVKSRVSEEGLQFLTITLPTFAKGIERCLELGFYESSLFRCFGKLPKHDKRGRIPKFLSGIVSLIFDSEGRVRKHESIEAIDGIRQICLVFNKTKKECTDDRKEKAIISYTACEDDVSLFRIRGWDYLYDFDRIVNLAFGNLLNKCQDELLQLKLMPRHGPGAVVETTRGNGKYRSLRWSQRLERVMPSALYLFTNYSEAAESGHNLELIAPKDEEPVKVIFVPKTQKTPRVIAIEPIYNQYVQQALMRAIVPNVESDPLLGHSIHFTDSVTNGNLARKSSIDRKLATLDMSEASDRVHASLVHRMLRNHPDLLRAVFSCRSKYARLPNGHVIGLKKFSSMGSALCFPMEAMIFYIIALIGMHRAGSIPITARSIKEKSKMLHVFGDDLILPSDVVGSVIECLESTRLKVNKSKTFVDGFFRESCGVDAYRGHLVTPVYVRTEVPKTLQDAEEFASYIASSNLFYRKGYWQTCKFLRERILDRIGPVPHVISTSPLLGYNSFLGTYTADKWCTITQTFKTKGVMLKVKKANDKLRDYRRLLKFFLTRGELPSEIEDFDKSVRRGSAYAKIRWNSPF